MAKKIASHIYDNPRFAEFRKVLAARGYILQVLWTASDGIYIFVVVGENPKHRTIVVRDYGEDNGFGVWLESLTGAYADGAEEIVTGNTKGPPNWTVMVDGTQAGLYCGYTIDEAIERAKSAGYIGKRYSAIEVG